MIFFQSVTTIEEAKQLYRKLAKQYHPDCGGDTETMVTINNEYEAVMKRLEAGKEATTAFKSIIDALVKFDGIDIEIIGTWIWVSGNTYPIRAELGKDGLGFKYSKNKTAWYWHEEEYSAHHKKSFSLDEIRMMHESKTVKSSGRNFKKELAGA